MNWKRGLTRIYFVLWGLFALAGGFFCFSGTSDRFKNAAIVRSFVQEYPEVTLKDLREFEPRGWLERHSKEVLADTSAKAVFQRALEDAADAARYAVENPMKSAATDFVYWFGACVALPGLLLLTIRWVASGFMKK